MRSKILLGLAALILTLGGTPAATAVDTADTRLLAQPAVSGSHIAFIYAGDLWVANLDGTGVRRLTTHVGDEFRPVFSPDGEQIAFSGEYDGNVDVYLIPTRGGVPKRLTWHPGFDLARDFTPDGKQVLFASGRNSHTNRFMQLFTVPVEGGFAEQLPIPSAYHAAFSPDGGKIAYTPLAPATDQWKHYRGGRISRIWLYDRADHSVVEIPQPAGGSNDADPLWMGDTVYFRSDRSDEAKGEFNLFAFDPATNEVRQLTSHADHHVDSASAGGGRIVYEQAGYLHLLDPASGQSQRLRIGVAADLVETRPRFVETGDDIRNGDISPSGARAVFEARGEIFTVPVEDGSWRNITQTPGVADRHPVWSPDGDRIAWFSRGFFKMSERDGRAVITDSRTGRQWQAKTTSTTSAQPKPRRCRVVTTWRCARSPGILWPPPCSGPAASATTPSAPSSAPMTRSSLVSGIA